MRRINEIFYSLQGEGKHTGVPSIFVRFSGCNLNCSFCDTDHAEGKEMTDEEIVAEVNKYPGKWVILTGGEPSLWIDEGFIRFLKQSTGKMVAVETNGSRKLPEGVDWVTVSPKSGFDGAGQYEILIEHANELKVIDLGQPLHPYLSLKCVKKDTYLCLQPCHVENTSDNTLNLRRTIHRVLNDPRWNLSAQMHRYLHIP